MNKNVIASISLLVAGVIIGVVVCIICLTTVEWQKASKASKMHSANRQLAAKVSTGSGASANTRSDVIVSTRSDAKTEKTLHVAHAKGSQASSQNFASGPGFAANSQTNSISQSSTPIDPSTRTVIPNILHQAVQTAPVQGQFVDAGMAPMAAGNGTVPASGTIQMMPTTYVIQQPVVHEIIVPGSVGPNRAVNSADAIPMPIGANGLQQNPCVDPSSSYGRAYNRGSSY